MADDELDARVTVLEENGGGSTQNGNELTKTFYWYLGCPHSSNINE